jgi:hypothetical protein
MQHHAATSRADKIKHNQACNCLHWRGAKSAPFKPDKTGKIPFEKPWRLQTLAQNSQSLYDMRSSNSATISEGIYGHTKTDLAALVATAISDERNLS